MVASCLGHWWLSERPSARTTPGSLCITRFKLTSCRPTFASEVVLDFTPPSLTSVRLSEPGTSASLVKDGGQLKVDVVSSEQLDTLTYTLDTRGPLCTYDFGMVSAQSMTLTTDGTLTGTHTKINITATYNSASLHCVLEVICITFVGEDMAGHKLTNPTTCRSFSPTDSEDYPGWFMLHNVGTGPSSVPRSPDLSGYTAWIVPWTRRRALTAQA